MAADVLQPAYTGRLGTNPIPAAVLPASEFELVSDGEDIPVFAFQTSEGLDFDVFDVSHELRARGWQVPAYTMPADATDIAVLRVVVREGFSGDLARMMLDDLRAVVAALHERGPTGSGATHFAH